MFSVKFKSLEDEILFGSLNIAKSGSGNKEKGWLQELEGLDLTMT